MTWLEYQNQGAIRSLPLNERLTQAMSFLPEMGITMRVHSGGQAAAGEGPRTGSTRHDHGNAADVEFVTADGTVLDGTNPAHRPVIADIVARSRANGVGGWGWGSDYMGNTRFHLGFGNEAVWGAGGRSANVDDWFRDAYYSGPSAPSQPPTQMAGGGSNALVGNAGTDDLRASRPPVNALAAEPPPEMDRNQLRLAALQAMSQMQPQINQLDPQAFLSSRRFG